MEFQANLIQMGSYGRATERGDFHQQSLHLEIDTKPTQSSIFAGDDEEPPRRGTPGWGAHVARPWAPVLLELVTASSSFCSHASGRFGRISLRQVMVQGLMTDTVFFARSGSLFHGHGSACHGSPSLPSAGEGL